MSSSDKVTGAKDIASKVVGLTRTLNLLTENRPGLLERAEIAAREDSAARSAVTSNQNETIRVLRELSELCDPQPRGRAVRADS